MVQQSVEPLHGSSNTRSFDGGSGGGGSRSSSVDERDEAKLWQQCDDDAEVGAIYQEWWSYKPSDRRGAKTQS